MTDHTIHDLANAKGVPAATRDAMLLMANIIKVQNELLERYRPMEKALRKIQGIIDTVSL